MSTKLELASKALCFRMVSLNAVWVGEDTPHGRQGNWRAKMAIKAGGEEPLPSESERTIQLIQVKMFKFK